MALLSPCVTLKRVVCKQVRYTSKIESRMRDGHRIAQHAAGSPVRRSRADWGGGVLGRLSQNLSPFRGGTSECQSEPDYVVTPVHIFQRTFPASCPPSSAVIPRWFGRWRPDTSLQPEPRRGIDVKPFPGTKVTPIPTMGSSAPTRSGDSLRLC